MDGKCKLIFGRKDQKHEKFQYNPIESGRKGETSSYGITKKKFIVVENPMGQRGEEGRESPNAL